MSDHFQCAWCGREASARRHGDWHALPDGWWQQAGQYEEGTIEVCSIACADAHCKASWLREEHYSIIQREKGELPRRLLPKEAENVALAKANERMVAKHGANWREFMRRPSNVAVEARR